MLTIRISIDSLDLERVAIVYAGTRRYPLSDRVEVVPLASLAEPGALSPR